LLLAGHMHCQNQYYQRHYWVIELMTVLADLLSQHYCVFTPDPPYPRQRLLSAGQLFSDGRLSINY